MQFIFYAGLLYSTAIMKGGSFVLPLHYRMAPPTMTEGRNFIVDAKYRN